MSETSELLREVRALRGEVRDLRADVAHLVRPRTNRKPLSPDDLATLALLLPACAAAVGNEEWQAAELLEHARLCDAELLRDIRAAYAGQLPTPKRLGRLLQRAANREAVLGFRVEQIRLSRTGAIWRVSSPETKSQETREATPPIATARRFVSNGGYAK